MKKIYQYEMNLITLNILSLVLFMVVLIPTTFFIPLNIEEINLRFLVYYFIWMALHEILHGVGFLSLLKVDFHNVIYGIKLEKGIFYCMCKQKINRNNILVSLNFPLIFIGIITFIVGILINNTTLILLSIMNIGGSIGDIVMTLAILKMPKDINYLDLDNPTSFNIISDKKLKSNYLGLKLVSVKDYDAKKHKPKDFKLLTVSKKSIWIILLFFMLFIIPLL